MVDDKLVLICLDAWSFSYVCSFFCKPGVAPLTNVALYMPAITNNPTLCASLAGGRPWPYQISSADFATLHPEENQWTQSRLLRTRQAVKSYVQANHNNVVLTDAQASLKIAMAYSGGGKRSQLNSFGKGLIGQ